VEAMPQWECRGTGEAQHTDKWQQKRENRWAATREEAHEKEGEQQYNTTEAKET
jgi:hypothetical protein